jgi:hypothetical protein
LFVDVVSLVSRRQNLRFINIIDSDSFQDLRLNEMTDAHLRHYRDSDRVHDLQDQFRITHPRYASVSPDISRNPFQRHYCDCASLLSNPGMFGRHDVHDHATF